MKRRYSVLIAAIAACCVFYTGACASDWATSAGSCYAKGDMYISAGIPIYPFGINAAFDYGFHDAISGGGGIGFRTFIYSNYFNFVGRAAFHPFNLKVLEDKIKVRDKFDVFVGLSPYFGIGLGNYLDWGIWPYMGGRWQFAPRFSLFVEECPGFGYLNVGINFKINR
jgi:hypothetical protein